MKHLDQAITSNVWSWIRSKFMRTRKSASGYQHTYLVQVYVEHPELPDHIVKQQISIAASSRVHARERLSKELRLRIGTARKHL